MPHSEQHRTQAKKNWLLFGILATLAGLFFALAFVKMGGGN